QLGKAILLSERSRQHFRTKRRTAHTADHDVMKPLAYVSGKLTQFTRNTNHLIGDSQPTERVFDHLSNRRVGSPNRSVFFQDALGYIFTLSLLQRFVDTRAERAKREFGGVHDQVQPSDF